MSQTGKDTNNGERVGFGDKTLNYLKKKSREAIEVNSEASVLYFEIDYINSKRNFYGEMLVKKWKTPEGVSVQGLITVKEGGDTGIEAIPNQLAIMEVVVYIDHLKELNIWPKIGDYFSYKNRHYFIWKRALLDTDKNSILNDKEAVTTLYHCVEADQESIFPPMTDGGGGTSNNLNNEKQF